MAGPDGGARFPKSLRLRHRQQFLKVQDTGFKVSVEPLLALALQNPDGHTRVGFTVSSKVGNAVVRNRIRRRLREIFRTRKSLLPSGVDVVWIARTSARDADTAALERAFEAIAKKLKGRFK